MPKSGSFIRARGVEVPHGFGTKNFDLEALRRLFPGRKPQGLGQVHGSRILILREGDSLPQGLPPSDGAVTDRGDVILVVRTADCLPVLLWDPETGAVGIAHAGWRGILLGVLREAIKAMREAFLCDPERIRVAIGPAIRRCCYRVGEGVSSAFLAKFGPQVIERRKGGTFLDLALSAKIELESMGVKQIEEIDLCTFCHGDLFHSFRRSGTERRQISFIAGGRDVHPG